MGEYDTNTDPDCDGDVCAAPVQNIKYTDVFLDNYNPKEFWNDIIVIKLEHPAILNGKIYLNLRILGW